MNIARTRDSDNGKKYLFAGIIYPMVCEGKSNTKGSFGLEIANLSIRYEKGGVYLSNGKIKQNWH